MTFFQFEADFVDSLRCIPMQVRYKLDTCGVKLKLHHWNQFSAEERQQLVEMACEAAAEVATYQDTLQQMVVRYEGQAAGELPIDPTPPWSVGDRLPEEVCYKAAEIGATLTVEQWQNLTPLQRFALIKLSRPGHENRNFHPALQEFQLIE